MMGEPSGWDKENTLLVFFLEQCSPQELMLELDTGWLVYAGVDAPVYIADKMEKKKFIIMHTY